MIKDVEGYKSCQHLFLLYRKREVSYKVKNAPRGCASRGEEVSCKQHRSSAKESQAILCSRRKILCSPVGLHFPSQNNEASVKNTFFTRKICAYAQT